MNSIGLVSVARAHRRCRRNREKLWNSSNCCLVEDKKKCCVRGDGNHRAGDLQITLVGEGRVAGRILSCGFIGENGAKWKCKRHSSTGQSRWHEVKDKKTNSTCYFLFNCLSCLFFHIYLPMAHCCCSSFSGWFVVWIWVIYEVILMRLDRIRQRREEERKNVEKKFLVGYRKSGANETCFSKRPREITRTTKKVENQSRSEKLAFIAASCTRNTLHSRRMSNEHRKVIANRVN